MRAARSPRSRTRRPATTSPRRAAATPALLLPLGLLVAGCAAGPDRGRLSLVAYEGGTGQIGARRCYGQAELQREAAPDLGRAVARSASSGGACEE